MPKYEKVDDNTIKVIVEKSDDVPVARLLKNRAQIVEERDRLNQTINNIDEILAEAKKLGIIAKSEEKNEPKNN